MPDVQHAADRGPDCHRESADSAKDGVARWPAAGKGTILACARELGSGEFVELCTLLVRAFGQEDGVVSVPQAK